MSLEPQLTDITGTLRQGCDQPNLSHECTRMNANPVRRETRSRNRRSQARAAIPEAWRELVEKPSPRDAAVSFQPQRDELLVELLASAVESKALSREVNLWQTLH